MWKAAASAATLHTAGFARTTNNAFASDTSKMNRGGPSIESSRRAAVLTGAAGAASPTTGNAMKKRHTYARTSVLLVLAALLGAMIFVSTPRSDASSFEQTTPPQAPAPAV